jgi:hypothetical protein
MIRILIAMLAATALWSQEPSDYKMTTHQVAFLRRGPNFTQQSTPETKKLQEAHMAHIGAMAKTGKSNPRRTVLRWRRVARHVRIQGHRRRGEAIGRAGSHRESRTAVLECTPGFRREGIGITQPLKGEQKK